jgi:hypothetical protein
MVVFAVHLAGARRAGGGGDDAGDAGLGGDETLAERGFARAGGAGKDEQHGRGGGHREKIQ